MNSSRRPVIAITALLALLAPHPLSATNGMNMEGYGPIATAMGGASLAFDNGTAAVINNPATLGLMAGRARLDLALGILGPKIDVTSPAAANNIFGVPPNQKAESTARAFFMPAFGYARRSGDLVYGVGVFGQGGMGCEYEPGSWRGLGFELVNRTEVSVGRAIVPLSYKVSDQLQIAATVDFVWAGMDLRMAMSGAQFFDLVDPRSQQYGRASGGIVQGFSQMMQTLPPGTNVDYAYFNFSNGSDFTGAARGYGYAGKVGFVYQPNPSLTVGGTYHSQTRLSDLKAEGSALSFQLNIPGMGRNAQSLAGDIHVRNFEWPAMLGLGVAFKPDAHWLLAADVRQVFWSDVMKQFQMSFVASGAASNGPFAGQNLEATLFQDWDDQTILQLGAAYQVNQEWTLRFGGNWGDNPIPDKYVNCLFPATVEKHLTAGLSWKLNETSSLDASFTYGFETNATNGTGAAVSHRQANAQVMYSYRF
ncbi:MAG: outer membrane protein transport protein [Verrucomicrobia bacterium]|nr:outer membrane protein transport protein [Verrucomicrobiota bacterium]